MREGWPAWARWLYERRQPEDVGAGDTAKRLFAVIGGEQYKLLRLNVGMPCKCLKRQAEWNQKYSY